MALQCRPPGGEAQTRDTGPAGRDLSAGTAITHEDVEIDNEGAVFALRSRPPQLVTWDVDLRRGEKRLFGDELCFAKMHMRPDGKELVVFRQIIGEENQDRPVEAHRYDVATRDVSRRGALDGLADFEVHWSGDLEHLFAAEAVGKGERESYRLVRVDLETGERKTMTEGVWFYGNASAAPG